LSARRKNAIIAQNIAEAPETGAPNSGFDLLEEKVDRCRQSCAVSVRQKGWRNGQRARCRDPMKRLLLRSSQDWRRAPTDVLFVDFALWLWLWSIVTDAQQDRGKTLD